MKNKVKVVELFAGVGGFRLGLEGWEGKSASSNYKDKLESIYKVEWGNQWEPSTKTQDAYNIYSAKFKGAHSNQDIQEVINNNFSEIPDHDLLVGGFPCQDYSVARTLNQSKGLRGKKGVLWWAIHAILEKKILKRRPVKYLMLENVDRLLKSPASQRGRDFAIMLSSLSQLGYAVEWRVINAADYGMPQRRRRVFFLGYHKSTDLYKQIKKEKDKSKWLLNKGVISNAFKVKADIINTDKLVSFKLEGSLSDLTESFNKKGGKSPFGNTGLMIDGNVFTVDSKPNFSGKELSLNQIIIKQNNLIPKDFFIDEKTLPKWRQLKGAKNTIKTNKQGVEYKYAEGGMVFPDSLQKPSRTIITGEGGSSPSRFKHVIEWPVNSGILRRLVPEELEKLNMFPPGHTDAAASVKRAFFMGNALVVGVVEKLGVELSKHIRK